MDRGNADIDFCIDKVSVMENISIRELAAKKPEGTEVYFKGGFDRVEEIYAVEKKNGIIRLSSLFMACAAAMSIGGTETLKELHDDFEAMQAYAANEDERQLLQLAKSGIAVSMYAPAMCSIDIREGNLENLPKERRAIGLYFYSKYLLSIKAFEKVYDSLKPVLLGGGER